MISRSPIQQTETKEYPERSRSPSNPEIQRFYLQHDAIRSPECLDLIDRLDQYYYKGSQYLAKGVDGTVDLLCGDEKCVCEQPSDCNTVLKRVLVGQRDENDALEEAKIGQLMGELGVGPRVLDFGICNGILYIHMERINGTPWAKLARSVDQETFDSIIEQIGDLVIEMKNVGVIHNDLHTNNILITQSKDGSVRPWILDYGRMTRVLSENDERTIHRNATKITNSFLTIVVGFKTKKAQIDYVLKLPHLNKELIALFKESGRRWSAVQQKFYTPRSPPPPESCTLL